MVLSLNIFDMQGRKLSHTPAFLQNENRISVDIKQLPAGMYVLEAETTGGNIRERMLKVHH
jgi:hypothetical protein